MSDIKLLEKIKNYDKPWCYQYQKRLDTLEEDMAKYGWSKEDIDNISLDDFEFAKVESKEGKQEAYKFIERYEWLGSCNGVFVSHIFSARYKGILGGVIMFAMPYAFSKLLGDNTREYERLIARGASASFTPKNLGSKFLMWCIKWMVNNTQYRLFTCYSDPSAKEDGRIYRALNFYYLGNGTGRKIMCINPYNASSVISDRQFRSRSFYKRYAKDLNIEWRNDWNNGDKIYWEKMPNGIEKKLKDYSKEMYKNAEKIEVNPKGKYAFVLGRNKKETKQLRKKFLELNKIYDYPKEMGK